MPHTVCDKAEEQPLTTVIINIRVIKTVTYTHGRGSIGL